MDAVVLCGVQGSGKTTSHAAGLVETHVRTGRDLLRMPYREARLLDLRLETRQRFAVDELRITRRHRLPYVAAARAHGFRTIAPWPDVARDVALERSAWREGRARVPDRAVPGSAKQLVVPREDEGFDEVWCVTATGDPDGYAIERLSDRARVGG